MHTLIRKHTYIHTYCTYIQYIHTYSTYIHAIKDNNEYTVHRVHTVHTVYTYIHTYRDDELPILIEAFLSLSFFALQTNQIILS